MLQQRKNVINRNNSCSVFCKLDYQTLDYQPFFVWPSQRLNVDGCLIGFQQILNKRVICQWRFLPFWFLSFEIQSILHLWFGFPYLFLDFLELLVVSIHIALGYPGPEYESYGLNLKRVSYVKRWCNWWNPNKSDLDFSSLLCTSVPCLYFYWTRNRSRS
jgi:hypothetical protein